MASTGVSAYALEVNQALLKEDDDLLRQTFLSVFRHHHPQLANKVDVIFALAQVNPGGWGLTQLLAAPCPATRAGPDLRPSGCRALSDQSLGGYLPRPHVHGAELGQGGRAC